MTSILSALSFQLEEIDKIEATLEELKQCRRNTPRHVHFDDLSPEERLQQLGIKAKYFIDTIKMIAYRGETTMAHIIRRSMRHHDEASRLLRSLYTTEAARSR